MKKYFLLILIGVAVGILWNSRSMFLGNNTPKSVLGVSVNNDVEKNLANIQQQVNKLPISEVSSSSPQIKKILHDLQGFGKYSTDELKTVCSSICKSSQK